MSIDERDCVERKPTALIVATLALLFLVVLMTICIFFFFLKDRQTYLEPTGSKSVQLNSVVVKDSLQSYTYEELAQISSLIAAEPDHKASLLAHFHIAVGDVREETLLNGDRITLRLIGIAQDTDARNKAFTGFTFMTNIVTIDTINETSTIEGGWKASQIRQWLSRDFMTLLPHDLRKVIKPVLKTTNNQGLAEGLSALSQTTDDLWLFSASEIIGEVTWFRDEFGEKPQAATAYVDFAAYDRLLSGEGDQYQWFAQQGVSAHADPQHALALTYQDKPLSWWYRTCYPYSFDKEPGHIFYQVMSGGYPASVGVANTRAGIVVGLCI